MTINFQLRWLSLALAGAMTVFMVGCEEPRVGGGEAPPATSLGTEVDDTVLTTQVKAALLADPDVKSFDFKVETRKGDVQLSGFVDSQAQVDRALEITRAVPGIGAIENNVSLKGVPRTVGKQIDDGIVTTEVKGALLADVAVKSFDIAVVTRQGEVQLSGFVDNAGQMERAMGVARGVTGVQSVSNRMNIKK